jgi:hypothetical protein
MSNPVGTGQCYWNPCPIVWCELVGDDEVLVAISPARDMRLSECKLEAKGKTKCTHLQSRG